MSPSLVDHRLSNHPRRNQSHQRLVDEEYQESQSRLPRRVVIGVEMSDGVKVDIRLRTFV